ncbi:response regulator transcription factor [Paraburkholderia sp. BR14263]|uniref:response regulator transcription factor n=1 Tax=unclassified Paraburkholderia TaxID=2615204 RepID=UPI0034CD1C97
MMNVLVLDTDAERANGLRRFLAEFGFAVSHAVSQQLALDIAMCREIDVILLDWQLSSFRFERTVELIRARCQRLIPAIFLVNPGHELDFVHGRQAGADDYILKPFSGFELVGRISLRLGGRGEEIAMPQFIRLGEFQLNPRLRAVLIRGNEVSLTMKEFDLISFLFANAGKVISRQLISMAAWGRPLDGNSRTLDTHIYRLRKKLDLTPTNGVKLSSVYTHGYRLDEVVDVRKAAGERVPVADHGDADLSVVESATIGL